MSFSKRMYGVIRKTIKKVIDLLRPIFDLNFKKIKKAFAILRTKGFSYLIKKIKNNYKFRTSYVDMEKDYKKWIVNNEPNKSELNAQRKFKFKYNPKISIIVPMYKTPEIFFNDLISCIVNQTYSNFELCLADGSPDKAQFVNEIINNDARIKYKLLEKNGGISENSNEALKMCTGEYIILLDHDDSLPEFALFEIVKFINEHMDAEFIYSDEDKFTKSLSERNNPHFKPDYSPDLLTSYNYITHLSIFKKELMDKLGGFRKEYDGAQDYDIILRATELTDKIYHISKILYHWRVHPTSTAGDSSTKTYAIEAGLNAVKAHLSRKNIKAKVEYGELYGQYKVTYELLSEPLVSIIILNKDCKSDLEKCVDSVLQSTYKNFEILIIENNSTTEEIFEYYNTIQKESNKVKVIYYEEKGFNFSRINNFAAKSAKGEYLLLLNNDTQVITIDWLENMISICQREDVGIVGAKLLYFDNTVQHAGVIVGMGGIAGHINSLLDRNDFGYYSRANVINNFSAVTGACLLVKKKIFDEVGGLDEEFKVAFNDIDFCLKVRRKNKLVVYTPFAQLYHFESKSRGNEDTPEKLARFKGEIELFSQKWSTELEMGDPYFNKNLRLDMPIFYVRNDKVD